MWVPRDISTIKTLTDRLKVLRRSFERNVGDRDEFQWVKMFFSYICEQMKVWCENWKWTKILAPKVNWLSGKKCSLLKSYLFWFIQILHRVRDCGSYITDCLLLLLTKPCNLCPIRDRFKTDEAFSSTKSSNSSAYTHPLCSPLRGV